MSPRHEASPPEPITISFAPMRVAEGPPPVQLRQRVPSGRAADPYRPMCGLEEVRDGDTVESWFRDQLLVAEAKQRAERSLENVVLRGKDIGDPDRPWVDVDLDSAKERLRVAAALGERELRDLSSGGNPFIPAGAAVYVAEAFAVAARARASLFAALPQLPLPRYGLKVEVPRLTSGSAVAVVSAENTPVTEVDPATALASSARAYIAGQVDASRQLIEMARPGFDQVLARDLGAALGTNVDSQLVTGINSSGQTEGLSQVSGTIAVSYTDASPTPNELVSKIWDAFRQIAEQGGGPPEPGGDNYLIVLAPRRLAWLSANTGSTSSLTLPPLPGRVVATAGIRTALGVGTNEDEIYLLARSESFCGASEPVIAVYPEVGSSTLTVRVQARQSVAAMFSRQPKAIARISGTGLVAPTL